MMGAQGDRFWKALVAAGSILVFGFEAGRLYLEKEADVKMKKLELDFLKEESAEKDQEIARLEAALAEAEKARFKAAVADAALAEAEKARRKALEEEQARSQGWFRWIRL